MMGVSFIISVYTETTETSEGQARSIRVPFGVRSALVTGRQQNIVMLDIKIKSDIVYLK
jgi:hypothetical protein